jgi:hypothetical protein
LFYTEAGRQASLAISHAFLDVSTEDVFIFEGSDAELADGAWKAARRPASDAVLIEIGITDVTRRRNGAVARVVAEHAMWIDAHLVFRGTGAWTIHPAALFQRLRKSSAARTGPAAPDGPPGGTAAPTPARIPHASGANVVISSPQYREATGEFASSLIVDDTHPYFFDHPCDHVPGMLLLEACTQLAKATLAGASGAAERAAVSSYRITFAQFVECGVPTLLSARADGAGPVRVSVIQRDVVCGVATVGLAGPAAA